MTISITNKLTRLPDTLLIPIEKQQSEAIRKAIVEGIDAHLPTIALDDFSANCGETLTLYHQNTRIILLGLGNATTQDIIQAFRLYTHKNNTHFKDSLGIYLLHFEGQLLQLVKATCNGLFLGAYQLGMYKSDQKIAALNEIKKLSLITPSTITQKTVKKAAETGIATAITQMRIFDLINAPSNEKTPQHLADWATQSGKEHDYSVRVLDKAAIEKAGMGGLLAVNRGSEHPPRFIIMEYMPKEGTVMAKVGLVGKGVTFDTGGLSIKPSNNMHQMKSDMGGAAAVLGTMELAAKLQLPVHLIGIVPSTDNSVDALSIKPGDVIKSYGGQSIEIIDTDAEGRLILADALGYITKHFNPEVLIDLATLTGSSIRALGYHAAALFSNNKTLVEQLTKAGEETGERVWQLPLWEVYQEPMQSDVADIKNFSGQPTAGAITAAKFLEFFTNEHPNWAHLDIAGVSFTNSPFAKQKSATAYGVRLLIEYIQTLASNKEEIVKQNGSVQSVEVI